MDNTTLVHALFDALDARDFDRFQSFFAPETVIWHNFDLREQPLAETVAMLQYLLPSVKAAEYANRRYVAIPGGAVAQHVLRVMRQDGKTVEMPVMMRLDIEGGLVRRVEEYFDMGQAASLSGQ